MTTPPRPAAVASRRWPLSRIIGAAVLVIALLSSLLSIRRVLVLEPAIVFQG